MNYEKKINELETKMQEQLDKKTKICKDNSPLRVKANYISCKKCGSKLNKFYITNIGWFCNCPVCKGNLYSTTAQERIAAVDAKYVAMRKELQKYRELQEECNPKPTFEDGIARVYDILDFITNRYDGPDFTEIHGETGGDVRSFRIYKDGTVGEK